MADKPLVVAKALGSKVISGLSVCEHSDRFLLYPERPSLEIPPPRAESLPVCDASVTAINSDPDRAP